MKKILFILLISVIASCGSSQIVHEQKNISIAGNEKKIEVTDDFRFRQAMQAIQNKDFTAASKVLIKLAESGHVMAQFNLGLMYEKGVGVKKDYEKAKALYEKAAAENNGYAQLNLGTMNENGYGFKRSLWEAIGWYYRAGLTFVEQGNKEGAKVALNTLLQADPKGPFIEKLKKKIEVLKEKGKRD